MLKSSGLEYGLKFGRGKFGTLASIRSIFYFLPNIPPTTNLRPSQVTNAEKKHVGA